MKKTPRISPLKMGKKISRTKTENCSEIFFTHDCTPNTGRVSYTRNCLCATCNFFFHFAMLLPTPEKICHQRLLIFFYQKEVARGKKRSKVAKFNGTFSRMQASPFMVFFTFIWCFLFTPRKLCFCQLRKIYFYNT